MIHHVNVQISNRQRTRQWRQQVLGAAFLDRGLLNPRQLQLRIGAGEMHFTETSEPVATGRFALEVDDWEGMLANLEQLGVAYTRARRAQPMPGLPARQRTRHTRGVVKTMANTIPTFVTLTAM